MNTETDKFCGRMLRRMIMALAVGGTALGAAFATGEMIFSGVAIVAIMIGLFLGIGMAGVFGGEILDMHIEKKLEDKRGE